MKLALMVCIVLVGGCSKKEGASGGSGGGGDDDGKVASCLMESMQSCREYRGGNLALGTKSLQELCTTVVSSAKFTETPCPTAKLIGSCKKSEGKDYYYEGYYADAKKIEEGCKQSGGTFAAK